MCGIAAYIGPGGATCFVYRSLRQLAYRGYDSAGLAFADPETKRLVVQKTLGSVESLALDEEAPDRTRLAFGHTRWATHGAATKVNCHPHTQGVVTLVHNGVIENTHALTALMKEDGSLPELKSETDTEIVAALLNGRYAHDPLDTLCDCLPLLEGSFALVIRFDDRPHELYCARKDSSLILAESGEACAASSDLAGLLELGERAMSMPDRTIARLDETGVSLYDWEQKPLTLTWLRRARVEEHPGKGPFRHYMQKEICEEPAVLNRLFTHYLRKGLVAFDDPLTDQVLRQVTELRFVACGTSYHAALLAKPIIERLAGIPCRVEIASEFRYSPLLFNAGTLFVALSQSGETADTLASLRLARSHGLKTLALLNVPHSAMAESADYVLLMEAGPEISVASTKAYQAQLALLILLALKLGRLSGHLSEDAEREAAAALLELPAKLSDFMRRLEPLNDFVPYLKEARHIFYLGRGIDYALAVEAALKIKEITYLYAEAYAAGELKHGTISLIEPGLPSVAFATDTAILPKTLSNLQELRSRGGRLLLIADAAFPADPSLCDARLDIPTDHPLTKPFYVALAGQVLAYRTARAMGREIDKPRNLAKSVTVE